MIKLEYDNGILYATKQYIISMLFPNISLKEQQKILRKCKKINIWNNNIFTSFNKTFYKCKNECSHNDYDCYYSRLYYDQEVICFNIENIPDNMKMRDSEKDYCYWIHTDVLISIYKSIIK